MAPSDGLRDDRLPLAVATLFRDEAPYFEEWIEYHRMVGVERFWLYDDSSSDRWREALEPHRRSGLVEVIDWSGEGANAFVTRQVDAQRDALRRAAGHARWLALIDADEFLLPLVEDTISACLERHFAAAAAVYVNWRNFGTGGVHLRQAGPLLFRLTACAPPLHPRNAVGKSIVRPELVRAERLWSPHHAILATGARYFNGDGEPIPVGKHEPVLDGHAHDRLIRINHYALRDEAHFRSVRLPRAHQRGTEEQLVWEHHAAFAQERDATIGEFIRRRHPARHRELWARPAERWPALGPYVSARVYGGLGNNLFQLAAASALAWQHRAQPVFPDLDPESACYRHLFLRCNVGPDPGGWRDFAEPSFAHAPIPFAAGTRIVGYFQSERYFAHHRERIGELFAPSPDDARHMESTYRQLLDRPDTVGIQLRYYRDEDPVGEVFPQYGGRYLTRALAQVPGRSLFVLSSNNLAWAKDTLPSGLRRLVVLEGEPDYIDLRVLGACRRLIITNSTFGWWAAWLGRVRTVLRPRPWLHGHPDGDVCPGRWTAIEADED